MELLLGLVSGFVLGVTLSFCIVLFVAAISD